MTPTDHHAHGLRFVNDWQCLSAADAEAIRAFWTRENANVEGLEATRRLREVVLHAVTEDGQIAAVATVGSKILPRLGQPMYNFRCFVGAAWRSNILPRPLLRQTQEILEPYAREHGFPCIGIVVELENARFSDTLRRAFWSSVKFSFIGINAIGQDVRVRYFRGARLKSREEIAELVRAAQRKAREEAVLSAQSVDTLPS